MSVQHSFNKDNEIHVKIGGDHGSFKLSYQIANVSHPNSNDNTVVFSIFEAEDYRSNIKIGLTRLREQINALQTMKWRWVMQYNLPLFQEERNYPTSKTWMLINFLVISQVICNILQYFATVLVFLKILYTPSENWCFWRITANYLRCCFTNETQILMKCSIWILFLARISWNGTSFFNGGGGVFSVGWVSFPGGRGTNLVYTFMKKTKYWPSLFKTFSNQPIRVFIFGDYEFLCGLYGISGANG